MFGKRNPRDPRHQQYFETDHLMADLKGRTVSGGLFKGMAQAAQFALNLVSTMVLARLLVPEDFGLVAIVLTVMGLVSIFKDAGLSTTTVQRERITHEQVSNLLWVNVGLGGLMSVVLSAVSPLLAWFYHDTRLVAAGVLLSLTFLLSGSGVQHRALLTRQMRFKLIAGIEFLGAVIGFATGLLMAWRGFGYWSLIGQSLAAEVSGLLLAWWACRWRPGWWTPRCGTMSLLGFGANITLATFIYALTRGLDQLLIGRIYGSAAVGLYSRAWALLVRPMQQVMFPLGDLVIQALARLQSQPDRYRRSFLQVNEAIALFSFAGAGMVLALAEPTVLVLLGPQWREAVPIFQGFSAALAFYPLLHASSWIFISQGRGKDLLLATAVEGVMTLAAIIGGLRFGPTGVAVSWSLTGLFVRLPFLYWRAGKSGPLPAVSLCLGVYQNLPVAGGAWAAAAGVGRLVGGTPPLVQLLVGLPAGGLGALAVALCLPESRRALVAMTAGAVGFLRRRGRRPVAEAPANRGG